MPSTQYFKEINRNIRQHESKKCIDYDGYNLIFVLGLILIIT